MGGSVLFYAAYALCVCLSLLCVLMVTFWGWYWRGGFSWDLSARQFNWHPVLMVSGLLVLYGNAAVVYRAPFTWNQRKLPWKLVHGGLMLLSLLLTFVGLRAVFDFHTGLNIPHLYSLHSWVGVGTVALFVLQWILGFAGFLFPCSPLWLRVGLKPVHAWAGKVILILGLISCISGITEKLLLTLSNSSAQPYSSRPAEAVFANVLGILITAFGLVVFGILSNDKWRRPETNPEGTPLLSHEDNTGRQ